MQFENRREAGRQLAKALQQYAGRSDVIVLGLPRGGVPVAFEVAHALHAPLDVFLVRKLGVPGQEELAMGAIASGGVRILNPYVLQHIPVSDDQIDQVTAAERKELARREALFRGDRPMPDMRGRTVILVDDGLATGATMRAAILALREHEPARVIIGVPVASPDICDLFRDVADDVICVHTPEQFFSVGTWYADFAQTADAEVRELLALAAQTG